MQSGVLERIRQLHADVELHRQEIVNQLMVPAKNFRHELLISHFILHKSKQVATKSDELLSLYDDEDYEHAKGQSLTAQEAMREFDAQLAKLREYHHSHRQPAIRLVLEEPSLDDAYVQFDANERHGRCLALQEHYSRYVTFLTASGAASKTETGASGVRLRTVDTVMSYDTFITSIVNIFQTTSCLRKLAALTEYSNFVVQLLGYVENFFGRVRPLHKAQVAAVIKETIAELNRAWQANVVPGWDTTAVGESKAAAAKRTALAEACVERYLAMLPDVLQTTRDFTVRQQTKTVDEIEREISEEEEQLRLEFQQATAAAQKVSGRGDVTATADVAGGAEDDDQVDLTKFNTKNFPLDAEGKPIPVWLYHLHGLHQKKHCEICLHTYYGERAYTQHFTELRHTKGLQRLGITDNVEELHLISTREAALAQWAKIRQRAAGKKYVSRPEDEQIEDAAGHVSTRGQAARMM
jgi:splicing factor 3A subunit 3